jgi:transcription initiation factor TFIID TATA-box-binding protein
MASIISHPTNALQAKAFTAPQSLSYPGGAGDITPPTGDAADNEKAHEQPNGTQQGQDVAAGNAPATPAATPGGGPGVSGIVPTLQ